MVLNFIKPDKTADFEMLVAKLKEALQKSEKPERKQQAASWKVFKAAEPGAARRDHLRVRDRPGRQGRRLHSLDTSSPRRFRPKGTRSTSSTLDVSANSQALNKSDADACSQDRRSK